jgi:hypothetical protein
LTTPVPLVDRRRAVLATAIVAAVSALSPIGISDAGAKLRLTHTMKHHALRAHSIRAANSCETQMSTAQKSAAGALYAHVKYAHLQTSPREQAIEALDADNYAKVHTVWIDSMFSPFVDAFTGPDC